jgi:ABC-2 type transport system ATP-binding protein
VLALDAQNLSHHYETIQALDGLSLQVEQGTLFGLLGPNGSGKTTLFRIISTLLKPTNGSCLVFDTDVVHSPDVVRKQLGIVFQQPAIDEALTIRQNLELHGGLYGLSGRNLAQRIEKRLSQLGLADRQNERCKNLSGGLLRRADLARGILHDPKLLLLDEPTNGLDPVARRDFWKTIRQLQQEGITVLAATHLMEEAALCEQLAIVFKGKCVANGTPDALCDTLGSQTLWLETHDTEATARQIHEKLGLNAEQVGNKICIHHPAPQTLFHDLYQHFGSLIKSATIRKPTLEDVFFVKTGNELRGE